MLGSVQGVKERAGTGVTLVPIWMGCAVLLTGSYKEPWREQNGSWSRMDWRSDSGSLLQRKLWTKWWEKNLTHTYLVQDRSHQNEECVGNGPRQLGAEPQSMPGTYFSFPQNDHRLSHAPSSWRSVLAAALLYPVHSVFLIIQNPTWKHPPPGVLQWSFPLLTAGLGWNWVPPAFPQHPLFDAPINHFLHLKVMRVV